MRPNRSNLAVLASLLAYLAIPPHAGAQDRIMPGGGDELTGQRTGSAQSAEGAAFLLLPVGARAVGMGGAVTGMQGSGDLLLWNPAGVASMQNVNLFFNHSETVFDTQSEVISALFSFSSIGNLGITYYLVDYGDLPSTGNDGSVQGNINYRNQEFLFTFAGNVVESLKFGVNYKLVQIVFNCDGLCTGQQSFTRTTSAFDFGLIYELGVVPIALGASVRHLGFPLKGLTQEDPLPTRVRVGMAWTIIAPSTTNQLFGLALAMDLEDQWREIGNPDVMLGSEFGVGEIVFVRAGYAFLDSGLGGPSLGLGVTYDWFYIDFSRGFDDITTATGDEAVQLSFGVTF